MPKLILMTGPTSTRQIPLQGPETTVGRAPLNTAHKARAPAYRWPR